MVILTRQNRYVYCMFDNIDSFIRGFRQYETDLKDEMTTIVVEASRVWYTNLVKRTPKDTGFAKMNWHFTVNSKPPTESIAAPEVRVNHATPVTPRFSEVKYGDVVYIYNNVSYIEDLEYGKSNQAPNGMLAVSLEETRAQLNNAIRAI